MENFSTPLPMPPVGYGVETAALIHLWRCQLNNVFSPSTSVVLGDYSQGSGGFNNYALDSYQEDPKPCFEQEAGCTLDWP